MALTTWKIGFSSFKSNIFGPSSVQVTLPLSFEVDQLFLRQGNGERWACRRDWIGWSRWKFPAFLKPHWRHWSWRYQRGFSHHLGHQHSSRKGFKSPRQAQSLVHFHVQLANIHFFLKLLGRLFYLWGKEDKAGISHFYEKKYLDAVGHCGKLFTLKQMCQCWSCL